MDHKASKYETIWSAEDADREEFLSETDVEDGQQEKHWRCEEEDGGRASRWAQPRSGILFILKSYRWIIDMSLLVVITVLLLLLLFRGPLHQPTTSSNRQIGGDFSASSHEIAVNVVKWNADASFVPTNTSEWFSDALVAKWNTMLPSDVSPPGGPTGEAGTIFSADSMTHQLHCLFMMGRIYSTLRENRSEEIDDGLHTHFMHCIDYIRQAAMCTGDVALEPHSASDGADLGPLDGGWNGVHVCKNYDEVVDYLAAGIRDGTRVVLPIDD